MSEVSRNIDDKKHSPNAGPVRSIFFASWCLLFLCALFASAVGFALPGWNAREMDSPISLVLFATQDHWWLWVVVITLPVAWNLSPSAPFPILPQTSWYKHWLAILVMLTVVTIAAGTPWIYRDFALSMDEFMMRFQSIILQNGYFVAPVEPDWLPLAGALRPGFLVVDWNYGYWAPGYRPGTAILHAGFSFFGLGGVMNAVFCGASVVLVAAIARQTLPNFQGAGLWAAIFLVISPQFLLIGMAPYTMTAHLLASLIWLYLFILDRPRSHLLAMVVGAFALGLHQINVHVMFALPFLLHLLVWRGRWKLTLAYVLAYAIALGAWIFWMDIATWVQGLNPIEHEMNASSAGGIRYLKNAIGTGLNQQSWQKLINWMINLSRFVAWQNAIVVPLLICALLSWRKLPVDLKLMAISIITTLLPYIVLMPDQGHGWGYRYLHPVLGNIAIIAAFGLLSVGPALSGKLCRVAIWVTGATFIFGVPLRAYQTYAVVAPVERAMNYINSRSTDIVLVDTQSIWYGSDLVRNDPFLTNSPIVLSLVNLPDARLTMLCQTHSTTLVDAEDLAAFGIKRLQSAPEGHSNETANDRLKRLGCIE